MNGMVDFVMNYHLFMNKDEEEETKKEEKPQPSQPPPNLYSKSEPKYRKKKMNQIFVMPKKSKSSKYK